MQDFNLGMIRLGRYGIWAGAAFLVLILIVAIVMFALLRGVSRPGEATARFIPERAPLYASINLRPGVSQLNLAREVYSLLRTDDFADHQDDLLEDIEDETDIQFIDDVTPWLGTDVSFALLHEDIDVPEWIVLVQIKDRHGATDFIDEFVDYLEDELHTEFDSDDYKDAELWVASDEPIAVGVTDEYLLMGDSETTLEDIIQNLESPPEDALANDEAFLEARESVPAQRVMFLFARAEDFLDLFESEIYAEVLNELPMPTDGADELMRYIDSSFPNYVAASMAFVKHGIRLDVVMDTPPRKFVLGSDNQLRSSRVLPADTLILLSNVGVPESWNQFRSTLRDFLPEADVELEMFLVEFEDDTAVDLERDVIDSISGEIVAAVLPSKLRFDEDLGGLSDPIEALLLADIENPRGILDALDVLTDMMEDLGLVLERDTVGNHDLVTADIGEIGEMLGNPEPGYVVTDDWVVLGSHVDGLHRFYSTSVGETNALASVAEFKRVTEMAPDPLHFFLFVDLSGIVNMIEDALTGDMRSQYRRDIQPFLDPLNAFMIGGSTTKEQIVYTAVLSLRE